MIKLNRNLLIAIVISIVTYFFFFYRMFLPGYSIWGSDFEDKHYPSKEYLYSQIVEEHRFPFWTEKTYGGFPIYADSEIGYLNPFNIVSVLAFGPSLSTKVLHFLTYLVGSLSLYYLIKRFGHNLFGFAAANLAFFFTYFMINHSIHINIIYIVFLLPLNILLADITADKINTKKYRETFLFAFLNALVFVNGFLWGHYQMSILVFISTALYLLVKTFKLEFKKIIISISVVMFMGVSSLIISLPQTLPTTEVYLQSGRFLDDSISFYEGVPSPSLVALMLYPQIWGDWENYTGKNVQVGYSYTEMYIYIGISVFILSILSFVLLKRNFLSSYYFISFLLTLFFCFIGYFFFVGHETPFLSSFRFWIRGIVIFSIPTALLISRLFSRFHKYEAFNNTKNVILNSALLLIFPLILLILNKWNPNGLSNYELFDDIYYRNLLVTPMGNYWMFISMATVVLILGLYIFMRIKKRIGKKAIMIISILLLLLISFDLRYFVDDVLEARIYPLDDIKLVEVPDEIKNKRFLLGTGDDGLALKSLNQDIWSPLGYSQYAPNNYTDQLNKAGLEISKTSGDPVREEQYSSLPLLYDLGILGYFDESKVSLSSSIPKIPYIKTAGENYEVDNYNTKEGNLSFTINTPESTRIDTSIKYTPDMKIKINNVKAVTYKNNLFLSFDSVAGSNFVQIKYFPRLFYYGLIVAVLYIAIVLAIFYKDTILRLYNRRAIDFQKS